MDWNWSKEAQCLGIDLSENMPLNIGTVITDDIVRRGFGDRTAYFWHGRNGDEKQLTYSYLAEKSSRLSAFLKSLGPKKGDRVFVYMDRIPELYISVPAILKAGGIAGPLFSSFGSEAIRDRLDSSEAGFLITQASLVQNILKIRDKLPRLKHILVAGEFESTSESEGIYSFDSALNTDCPISIENTKLEDPALIHYTSGTTGRPKGAVHTHSAVIGHYATAKHVLDLKQEDIYWCTADPAWVTGMSYGIIGPMANAAMQVTVEGNLTPRIILETIQKYKVSVLYTAPTMLRMLMREKDEFIRSFDLSSLRFIASVGEALNPEIIRWSEQLLGLPVHDTWFQTETGCIMLANTPGHEVIPGSMGKPLPPVEAVVVDKDMSILPPNMEGTLALKPGWPSMFADYWNNRPVYEARFRDGWYLTGDSVKMDTNGYFWFVARDDDVINTAGHLVSPFEVESALLEYPAVAESAVIGLPDKMIGEKIKAYIVLKSGAEESGQLKVELRSHIRRLVSPFAVPQEIDFLGSLPKTRTGKILRRLLKARELGMPVGDISTLEE